MATGAAQHSRPAVQRLAEIADGNGGQAILVAAAGPPFYAGLHRNGAETLLEAVLTLLNPRQYDEVLLITGAGEHLPDVQITSRDHCGRQRMMWFLKSGNAGSPSGAPSGALSGLDQLGDLSDVTSNAGQYQVLVPSHLAAWPERMTDLVHHVTERLKPGGPRRLIVIDDQFLQPRAQHDQAGHSDRPLEGKGAEIERGFKALPALCRKSRTDLILICRSRPLAEAITAGEAAARNKEPAANGPIAYEMLHDVGDSDYARIQATNDAKLFPKLVWTGAPILQFETMAPDQWNGGWLPSADPRQQFYNILRSCPPVPKDDPLSALDRFVGMDQVRDRLRSLRDLLALDQELRRRGQATEPMSLHVALYGQPGTGKTEVAKAIAHIYRQLGVLPGPFVGMRRPWRPGCGVCRPDRDQDACEVHGSPRRRAVHR